MKTTINRMLAALLLGCAANAFAAVPGVINFQGRLLDPDKLPRTGTYPMTFRICDSLEATCAAPCGTGCRWYEDQSVTVTNGVFSVQLGSFTATVLTPSVFSVDKVYLQITVDGQIMSPREQLAGTPYSFKAAAADSLATAQAINGTNFDGSAAITVPVNSTNDDTNASTMYPLWTTGAGNTAAKVSTGKLSFVPNTGILSATGFVGNLTGNASGTAATVTGAAQSLITSVGTLTGLTMSGAISGATTLSMDNQLTNSYANAAALNLTGNGAGLTFTGTGPNQLITASGVNLALMPGGTGNVGVGIGTPQDILHIAASDTASTVLNVLRLQRTDSDSAGAAGLGAGIDIYLEDSASSVNQAARLDVVWNDATDASEDSSIIFNVMRAGALTEGMRVNNDGGIRVAPAALPVSPVTGDIAIDSGDSNGLKWYDGTVWRENPQRVAGSSGAAGPRETWQVLTADSATCGTVALCAAAMTTTAVDAGTWKFVYTLVYQSAATGTGIAFGVNHTGAATTVRGMWRHITSGGAAATGIGTSASATAAGQMGEGKTGGTLNAIFGSASAGVVTANSDVIAVLEGILVVTNTGSLELKIATEVNASNVKLMANSTLELKKIK